MRQVGAEPMLLEDAEPPPSNAIVLAEDKKYYPSAEEARAAASLRSSASLAHCLSLQVYGPGTETLVMDEDAQQLEARPASTEGCFLLLMRFSRSRVLAGADHSFRQEEALRG